MRGDGNTAFDMETRLEWDMCRFRVLAETKGVDLSKLNEKFREVNRTLTDDEQTEALDSLYQFVVKWIMEVE